MSDQLKRKESSLAVVVTKVFESIGVLNKGSADLAKGDGNPEAAAKNLPVVAPALNVTRVTGFAAVIASAGAAALAIFRVDSSTDHVGVVAAAYGSTGLIVAASLIAAAVVLHADISARSQPSLTAPATTSSTPDSHAGSSSASNVKSGWDEALKRLETTGDGLEAGKDRRFYSSSWRDASGTSGMVAELTAPACLRDEHARLQATQGRIIHLLKGLIDDQSESEEIVKEIQDHIRDMRETVNNMLVPAAA